MRLVWFGYLLSVLLVAGCGASRNFVAVGSDSLSSGTSTLSGRVFLGSGVSAADVSVLDGAGSVLARTTTAQDGSFSISASFPSQVLVVARVPGTQLDFFADSESIGAGGGYVVVNVPTTLVHLYRKSSGAGLAQAQGFIRNVLGVSADARLDLLNEESTVAPFSHLAFFRQAEAAGGWAPYQTALTQSVSAQSADDVPPFLLTRQTVAVPFTGLESGLLEVVERARQGVIVLSEGEESLLKSALKFVGEGLGESIQDPLIEEVWTWVGGQLGYNIGTTEKLNEILSELSDVLTELDVIEGEISFLNFIGTVNDLKVNDIQPLITLSGQFTALEGEVDITNSPGLPSNNTNVPKLLVDLSDANTQASILTNLSNIQGAVYGPGNIVQGYMSNFITAQLGIDQPARFAGMPVRSYPITGSTWSFVNYYLGYQTTAMNLLAEIAHATSTTSTNALDPSPNLAQQVTSLLPLFRKAARLQALQQQQVVSSTPSANIIIDLESGLMWYSQVHAAQKFDHALQDAANLSVSPFPGVTYDDWRLPTYNEALTLQARGRYCSVKDGNVNKNSNDAYPDAGQSAAGLTALGFSNVTNINQKTSTSGSIWIMSYFFAANGEYFYDKYAEFRLNFLNNNFELQDENTDRPFIMVRSIGKPLCDWINPKAPKSAFTVEADYNPSTGLPGLLDQYQAIADAEYPLLGVPTAIVATVDGSATQVSSRISYTIFLGGDFRVGTNGKDEPPYRAPEWSSDAVELATADQTALAAYLAEGSESANAQLQVSNLPDSEGAMTWYTDSSASIGPINVTATVLGYAKDSNNNESFPVELSSVVPVTNPTPTPRGLTSIMIVPGNHNNEDSAAHNSQFQAVGFYDDGTVKDLTAVVEWSLEGAPPNASIGTATASGSNPGLLEVTSKFPVDAGNTVQFTIKISIPGASAPSPDTIRQDFTDSTQYRTVTDLTTTN